MIHSPTRAPPYFQCPRKRRRGAQERYEYDAYGNCHVLEPNFAPDPDGISDYGNPYLCTASRLDILDNGSFKLQYNRNRYYDQYTGRWLTHDPLGITPNGGLLRPSRYLFYKNINRWWYEMRENNG